MSTFTDWNGPQGSGLRTSELTSFINEYTQLVTTLNNHIKETAEGSNVHGVQGYVGGQVEKNKGVTSTDVDNKLLGYYAKSEADAKFATDTAFNALKDSLSDYLKLSDVSSSQSIKDLVSSQMSSYLPINDLDKQSVIQNLKAAIDAITVENDGSYSLKLGVDQLENLLKTNKVMLSWLKVARLELTGQEVSIAGTNIGDKKSYFVLGQLTETLNAEGKPIGSYSPCTAYVSFNNDNSFRAIVNAVSVGKDSGSLSVLYDGPKDKDIEFLLIYGTDKDEKGHVYLACSSGIFNTGNITFTLAGVNLLLRDMDGYIDPNGLDAKNVLEGSTCTAKCGLNVSSITVSSITANSVSAGNIDSRFKAEVGQIVGWSKCNDEGVAEFSEEDSRLYLPCNGGEIKEADYPELFEKIGGMLPLVDFHAIVARPMP